jgi:NDP-sugar pyrophosphorylase family protein
MELSPAAFFDLSSFAHAELFEGMEYVWEAIPALSRYLERSLEPGIAGQVEPGAHLLGEGIQIGSGTVVEAGATVRGPVIIGSDCTIRSGAILRGGNLVGDGCTVGNSSELKNTLLLDGANAPHFNDCGDSILGARSNLGAGTKLSNLRFDDRHVVVMHEGQSIDTGLRKFGAILGDGAQTGCNAVLNPGTMLGPGAIVFPCAVVAGIVEPGRRAR